MAEWSKALDSKSSIRQRIQGSNPCLSATSPVFRRSEEKLMHPSSPLPALPLDPDLRNAQYALERAAKKALQIALQTGTPCYIWREGRIVDIAAEVRALPAHENPPT
jgi:hypothetical protein